MTDRCPGSGPKTTGTYPVCPCCNRRYATRKDGTIRVHNGLPPRADGGCPYRCPPGCDLDCYFPRTEGADG